MRHAIVSNGIVTNVAVASEDVGQQRGWIPSHTAQIGWLYDGGDFSEPAQPPGTPAQVNAEHDARVLAGKTFTLTGYGDVALEGSARTQIVLLTLDRNAERLKDQGVTDPVLMLTDRENTDHYLTPDQIISLVSLGTAWMQEMHDAKRTLKEMEPIPADFASNEAYWPD